MIHTSSTRSGTCFWRTLLAVVIVTALSWAAARDILARLAAPRFLQRRRAEVALHGAYRCAHAVRHGNFDGVGKDNAYDTNGDGRVLHMERQ